MQEFITASRDAFSGYMIAAYFVGIVIGLIIGYHIGNENKDVKSINVKGSDLKGGIQPPALSKFRF